MKELPCSLCSKKKKAAPLDMNDPIFGSYVKFMRRIGLSDKKENLGICNDCMPQYLQMEKEFKTKLINHSVIGIIIFGLFAYFTENIIIGALTGLFVIGLSLFSYCPPLKNH
jgi:hypothetical protein